MRAPTLSDVLEITGTNGRQLHIWCSEGLVPGQPANPGSGRHRVWTWGDVETVMVLRQLAVAEIYSASFRAVLAAVLASDWRRPVEVPVSTYVTVTVDLPAIARTVAAAMHRP